MNFLLMLLILTLVSCGKDKMAKALNQPLQARLQDRAIVALVKRLMVEVLVDVALLMEEQKIVQLDYISSLGLIHLCVMTEQYRLPAKDRISFNLM